MTRVTVSELRDWPNCPKCGQPATAGEMERDDIWVWLCDSGRCPPEWSSRPEVNEYETDISAAQLMDKDGNILFRRWTRVEISFSGRRLRDD